MKNKVFTVTQTNLNTHNVISNTTVISGVPAFYQNDTRITYEYPRRIQFINKSGQDVKVNILSSPKEETDYTADATNYQFFTIPSATVFNMGSAENLPNAYKILTQLPSATASGDFIIECIGYQELI